MLLNGDKYGAIGKIKERQLIELVTRLQTILEQEALSNKEKLAVCINTFNNSITSLFTQSAKGFVLAELFATDIEIEFNSLADIVVFIISVKYIIAPMNAAIAAVPSSDTEFCHATAKSILDTLGATAVSKVVSTWDNLGVKGCLDVERSIVVSEFTKLRANIASLAIKTEFEKT